MDLAIAIGQGLGLAVAAGFFATAPLAVAASVAALERKLVARFGEQPFQRVGLDPETTSRTMQCRHPRFDLGQS